MKDIMHEQVSSNHVSMFQDATLATKRQLDIMCKQCRDTLHARVQRVHEAIARDYLAVTGTGGGKDRAMGKPERIARKKVEDVILKSEDVFSEVLSCDVEQLAEMMGMSGRVFEVESDADVEDATQPLVILSDDGLDEDDMVQM